MPMVGNLPIRWKLMAVILPLAIIPVLIVGVLVGYVSHPPVNLEIARVSKTWADDIWIRIFIILAISIPLVVLITGILVILLSNKLTDTLDNVLNGIQAVKRGRLDTRLPVTSDDELGELTRAFNSMTAVLRDNKSLEINLAQQDRMASLGVLSATLVQQINHPLGVILGHAAYLEGKMIPADPKYKYVQEIKQESKRCKTIVQNLLDRARLPKSSPEKTDINALLDQIVDFTVSHIGMDSVVVKKVFDPRLPRIYVDKDQLRQVALHLMLNARAAIIDGGRLLIGTSLGNDDTVQLTFEDNGIGIAPENVEKIFEPFFISQGRDTGLGLAITKAIIEQHGGSIQIDSKPGKGTTVIITLLIDGVPAENSSVATYSVD